MSTITDLETEQAAYADQRRALLTAGDTAGLLALDARAAQLPALLAAAHVAQLRQTLAALAAEEPAIQAAEQAAGAEIGAAQAAIAAWERERPDLQRAFNVAHGHLRAAQGERARVTEQRHEAQRALAALLNPPPPAGPPTAEPTVTYMMGRVSRPMGA